MSPQPWVSQAAPATVRTPRARRRWERVRYLHVKARLSGLREIPEGM
ncbi:MAG: hypothetical protein GX932_09050 [Methanomicrobiales archaeon]|nr:hypothetical protein [Methanomicrobiales archaeon]